MIGTELHLAPGGQRQPNDEHQKKRHRQHVKPAERLGDEGEGGFEQRAGQGWIADRAGNQQDDDDNRRNKHWNQHS